MRRIEGIRGVSYRTGRGAGESPPTVKEEGGAPIRAPRPDLRHIGFRVGTS